MELANLDIGNITVLRIDFAGCPRQAVLPQWFVCGTLGSRARS
jgi:hypothetical protein